MIIKYRSKSKSQLSELLIFFFLFYLLWYKEAVGHSALFLYGGAFIVLLSTILYINGKKISSLYVPRGIRFWFIYMCYSIIIGLVVAFDYRELLSSSITFFAFMAICTCIGIVCIVEKDIDWLLKSIIIISIICACYTIMNGYPYYNGVIVTTMGPENNPNTLGVLMVIGIFCSVYVQKDSIFSFLITLIENVLFMYVIILTASKKALLSAGVIICIWAIVYIKKLFNKANKVKVIVYTLVFVLIFVIVLSKLQEVFLNSASFDRMQLLFSSGSTSVRENMYSEAWHMFLENPIFGVGYNQFRFHSTYGAYAHSTYAEVISGAGLFGSILYFAPIIICGKKIIKDFVKGKQYRQGITVGMLIVELFLGSVQIYMYEFIHMLIWTLLFIISEKNRELH